MAEYTFRDHEDNELTIRGTEFKQVQRMLESGASCAVTVYKTDERGFIATTACQPGTGQGEYWARIIQDLGGFDDSGSIWTLEDLIDQLEDLGRLPNDFPAGVGAVVEQAAKELRAEH